MDSKTEDGHEGDVTELHANLCSGAQKRNVTYGIGRCPWSAQTLRILDFNRSLRERTSMISMVSPRLRIWGLPNGRRYTNSIRCLQRLDATRLQQGWRNLLVGNDFQRFPKPKVGVRLLSEPPRFQMRISHLYPQRIPFCLAKQPVGLHGATSADAWPFRG
jgi:hypothetical protein